MTTRIVCWNINKTKEPWRQLLQMDADIALLQEAGQVPSRCGWGKSTRGLRSIGTRTFGIHVGTRRSGRNCMTGGRWW